MLYILKVSKQVNSVCMRQCLVGFPILCVLGRPYNNEGHVLPVGQDYHGKVDISPVLSKLVDVQIVLFSCALVGSFFCHL